MEMKCGDHSDGVGLVPQACISTVGTWRADQIDFILECEETPTKHVLWSCLTLPPTPTTTCYMLHQVESIEARGGYQLGVEYTRFTVLLIP